MSKVPYTPPTFNETSFNCPFCHAYAMQSWASWGDLYVTFCKHCHERSTIWYEEKMIFPDFSGIEPPNYDLAEDIKADYLEAASIVQKSPRGAAALLRFSNRKIVTCSVERKWGKLKRCHW